MSCSSTNSACIFPSYPLVCRCLFSNDLKRRGIWGFCSDNVFITTPDSLLSERLVRAVYVTILMESLFRGASFIVKRVTSSTNLLMFHYRFVELPSAPH